ncbi:hypothetical protein SUDANB150_01461 [Streptomyces sp. enrichment culture]
MLGQTDSERGLSTFQNYDYLGTPMTAARYETAVRSAYGEDADAVLAEYPLSDYATPGEAWTDAQNGSTSYTRWQLTRTLSKWVPTYAYEFAESDTPHFTSVFRIQQKSPSARDFPFGGAVHVDDLGYLWDYLGQTLPYDGDQLELSRQMIGVWGRFTASGDPNGPDTPAWPRFSDRTGALMSLVACDTSPASGDAPGRLLQDEPGLPRRTQSRLLAETVGLTDPHENGARHASRVPGLRDRHHPLQRARAFRAAAHAL